MVKLRPNYGFRAGEQHAVYQRHGASRGKQLVFIRPYDICTDASPRWCLTGPQGHVRAVLYWGSPLVRKDPPLYSSSGVPALLPTSIGTLPLLTSKKGWVTSCKSLAKQLNLLSRDVLRMPPELGMQAAIAGRAGSCRSLTRMPTGATFIIKTARASL